LHNNRGYEIKHGIVKANGPVLDFQDCATHGTGCREERVGEAHKRGLDTERRVQNSRHPMRKQKKNKDPHRMKRRSHHRVKHLVLLCVYCVGKQNKETP